MSPANETESVTNTTTMKWVNIAVKPDFSWPNRQIELEFGGKRIVLQPLSEELACTVSVFDEGGLSFDSGGSLLCRFLSCLAWSMDAGVVELFLGGSSNSHCPGRMGRLRNSTSSWISVEPWDYLYLPSPKTREAELALALYREGLNLNSVPFSFLSFFKVLNVLFSDGPSQMDWIKGNLDYISYGPALNRLKALQVSQTDTGKYLYTQGRCAVAHANALPIANPDDYSDKRRLELDIPLIKEIAAHFIERELGVLSDSSFWKTVRKTEVQSPELLRKTYTEGGLVKYVQ